MKAQSMILAACALALFACKQDNAGQTTTTGAGEPVGDNVQFVTATARIAGARCDRSIVCDQVGMNKRFETRDACAQGETNRTRNDLRAAECANGVEEKRLRSCLDALSKQDCAKLMSSVDAMDECKTAALCLTPTR
jgi:hypothetical protein